ncbi:hypothetical protein TNCV_2481601 [Trichonephila clavipes]|nr:hypothetical protein TNCV_2481601 [Trichonephila clavipes]
MRYSRETNCSPLAPTKLRYRTEESSPRSLEPFEPTTHPSSHSNSAEEEFLPIENTNYPSEKSVLVLDKPNNSDAGSMIDTEQIDTEGIKVTNCTSFVASLQMTAGILSVWQ